MQKSGFGKKREIFAIAWGVDTTAFVQELRLRSRLRSQGLIWKTYDIVGDRIVIAPNRAHLERVAI